VRVEFLAFPLSEKRGVAINTGLELQFSLWLTMLSQLRRYQLVRFWWGNIEKYSHESSETCTDQDSVVTKLTPFWDSWNLNYRNVANSLLCPTVKEFFLILKIGQYLTKIWTRIYSHVSM